MKVVFLDVDGVLNHAATDGWKEGESLSWKVVDASCVEEMRRIIRLTGAKVVISSSWRFMRGGTEKITELFPEVIGETPSVDQVIETLAGTNTIRFFAVPRFKEIEAWLKLHPEVESFVVIDDESDAEIKGKPFVQTRFSKGGLTKELADVVIAHLTKE